MNPKIESQPTANGLLIRLPRRDLTNIGKPAMVGLCLGSLAFILIAFWMAIPVAVGLGMIAKGIWLGSFFVGFALTGLTGIPVAWRLLTGSIGLLQNQTTCEIELNGDSVLVRERLGLASFVRSQPVKLIRELAIVPLSNTVNQARDRRSTALGVGQANWILGAQTNCHVLLALSDRPPFPLAYAYPSEILQQVGERFREALLSGNPQAKPAHGVRFAIGTEADLLPLRQCDSASSLHAVTPAPDHLPESSDIIESVSDHGVTWEFPAKGLINFFFALAMLWLGFMAIFTIGTFFDKPAPAPKVVGVPWGAVSAILFTTLFWLIGIGILIHAIFTGTRKTIIGVHDDRLMIQRKSVFGETWKTFDPRNLLRIEVAASTVELNEEPQLELQIHSRGCERFGLLYERDDAELCYVAQRLRELLHVDVHAREDSELLAIDQQVIPDGVQVSRTLTGSVISVPRPRFAHSLAGMMIGLLLVGGGATVTAMALGGAWGAKFELVPFLFGTVLTGLGIAILIGSMLLAFRRYELRNANGQLSIIRTGLFGSKSWVIRHDLLVAIEMVETGAAINSQPQHELRIDYKTAMTATSTNTPDAAIVTLRLFRHQPDATIAWYVTTLREASGLLR